MVRLQIGGSKVCRVGALQSLKPNGPHVDLWTEILDTTERLGPSSIVITKVAAHQDVSVVPNAFENWAFQHNIVADRAARLSNLQRDPSFWDLHRQHSCESQWAQQVSLSAQTVILDVSRKVVARENVLLTDEVVTGVETENVGPVMSAPAPIWDGFLPSGSLPEGATMAFRTSLCGGTDGMAPWIAGIFCTRL